MAERPMTPDERVRFERDVVQHGESEQDPALPASESDSVPKDHPSPAEPAADVIRTPD